MHYLFDTTYFVQFLGFQSSLVNIKQELKILLTKINFNKYFSMATLLELKWLALREFRNSANEQMLELSNSVIQSLIHGRHFESINPWSSNEILSFADKVRLQGHADYNDCLILATAKHNGLTLISEDTKFPKLIQKLDWELEIMHWKQFTKLL